MIVTVFRARLKEGADLARLEAIGTRMAKLAPTMPGFVSYKDFSAEDGEGVTVVEFETLEQQLVWRAHPEHLDAQRAARELFGEYRITVCEVLREVAFPTASGAQSGPPAPGQR